MRGLASVGGVGGLVLGWLGIVYKQRTISTYNLVFFPIRRSAPFWGLWQTYMNERMNKQTNGPVDRVSLSMGTLLGNREGAPLLETLRER